METTKQHSNAPHAPTNPQHENTYPDLSEKIFHELSIPADDVITSLSEANAILERLLQYVNEQLDTARRLRANGIGIRRYGFTDKLSDIAEENLKFAPPAFDNKALKQLIRQIELLRNLSSITRQVQRIVDDELLIAGDEAFGMALLYYNSLRVQARQRVPGAEQVLGMLEPFFNRRRTILEQPTAHEIERDLHALVHGHKDGKIVVERERPHLEGGKFVVKDETHRDKDRFRGSVEGEIDN
jgi:hypothetical protein